MVFTVCGAALKYRDKIASGLVDGWYSVKGCKLLYNHKFKMKKEIVWKSLFYTIIMIITIFRAFYENMF